MKGKELQSSGTNLTDKTLKHPESTYKTTFLVVSNIWYKICTRARSPFPLIQVSKTMNLVTRVVTRHVRCRAGQDLLLSQLLFSTLLQVLLPLHPRLLHQCPQPSNLLQTLFLRPLSSELGTCKTVKAKFWPSLEPFFRKMALNL